MENGNGFENAGPLGRPLALAGRIVRPFERFARRVLGANGDLKVLAVIAAALVYSLVKPLSAGIERTVSVPVVVLPDSEYSAVVGVEPSAVAVTLRGAAEDFTAFDADALRAELRPTPAQGALSETLDVGPQDVTNVLDKLRVVSVSPAKVSVDYDFMSVMVTTNFVARPRLVGRPVQGVASVSLPTNLAVRAYGSVKRLAAFSAKNIRLPTDPIDVEGKTESFDALVAIRPPEDSGITRVEPAEVEAHVTIHVRAALDAGEIHVSAPVILAPETAPAKDPDSDAPPAATNAPAASATNAPPAAPAAEPAAGAATNAPPADSPPVPAQP